MATVINVKGINNKKNHFESELLRVRDFLPSFLYNEIFEQMSAFNANGKEYKLEEIRIRRNRHTYLTLGGLQKQNILLKSVISGECISEILERMCNGSLYAYGESILKGYISLGNGIRVGVCGQASVEGTKILGIYNICALNIRLPCVCVNIPPPLLASVRGAVGRGRGVLIYSPPAQGKTTLLRSLARELSGGANPMRTALIDSREEFGDFFEDSSLSLDILSGYPQAEGIHIATAFMNPEVIICDEIGTKEEAEAIAQAQNCGVPLIASAHGVSFEGIMHRSGMSLLHDVEAFGLYIGIRIDGKKGFEYTLQEAGR